MRSEITATAPPAHGPSIAAAIYHPKYARLIFKNDGSVCDNVLDKSLSTIEIATIVAI